ncbi:hypothetical protein H257_11000 [Aphanomyces astaci]|uniref:Uncharacterized protein n=1 Tax=Aphanomyces astaci TaxID=112090 RepID=W4G400_APHAT|nr:hypothetical protein H257_11000 [Aphanomyces astaci]ETV74415.1 hypothetical protein H257_11000 [Aphanomyces astaci]|eukprot:XP_009836073.1 hypothetical protein H257_11000 [Aphanomyces astaci]
MPLPLVTLIGVLLNATIGAAIFQAAEDREAAKHVPADVLHASVDKWIIPCDAIEPPSYRAWPWCIHRPRTSLWMLDALDTIQDYC